MMIVYLNTSFTSCTMKSSWWSKNFTCFTKWKFKVFILLFKQTIYFTIVIQFCSLNFIFFKIVELLSFVNDSNLLFFKLTSAYIFNIVLFFRINTIQTFNIIFNTMVFQKFLTWNNSRICGRTLKQIFHTEP